jgi:hypothetical protein
VVVVKVEEGVETGVGGVEAWGEVLVLVAGGVVARVEVRVD